MRRLALVATMATAALALTGCSGGSGLDGIDVSSGDTPKVTVDKDFAVTKTETRVIDEGDGDKVKTGDTVEVNYVAVNGRSGKEFDNSFKNKTPMTLTLSEKSALPGFEKGLVGQTVGSRVLVAVAPKDGASLLQSTESLGLKKKDTMVFLFDLESVVPTEASGTAQKVPASVPTLTYDENKHPKKFTATKQTAKKLDKSAVHTVIKGTGKPVEKGQTITIHYVGQKFPAGEVFQESWTAGTPLPVSLAEGASVPCFSNLLPGQTVGSRVIVECTTNDAYGKDAKANNRPDGPLIFAVDILSAS